MCNFGKAGDPIKYIVMIEFLSQYRNREIQFLFSVLLMFFDLLMEFVHNIVKMVLK